MSILKNAIDSIAIGLEDFESGDERRLLSATRNIFAGILLLFKHKLSEMSPSDSDEVLIKQRILPINDPKNGITWRGKGNKTVDVQNIKDRFNSLDIKVNWSRIDKINRFRNEIEHYYSDLEEDAIQSLISESFIVICDFITDHLDDDPAEVLGQECYNTLLETSEVYKEEKKKCIEKISLLKYPSEKIPEILSEYNCDNCGSSLIAPIDETHQEFRCKSCEKIYIYDNLIKTLLNLYFRDQIHSAEWGESEYPIINCPECLDESYIVSEEVCAICEYRATHRCERCHAEIPVSEISDEPYCGWCLNIYHKIMIDD